MSLYWLTKSSINFSSLISSSSSRHYAIEQQNIFCTLVFQSASVAKLTIIKYQHSSKPLTLAVSFILQFSDNFHMTRPYNPETYWDTVAENISSRSDLKIIAGDDEPYYRYKRRRFLELLGNLDFSNKVVLEIGSGPGGNLDFIYNKGCKKITGVDVSSQMVHFPNHCLQEKT